MACGIIFASCRTLFLAYSSCGSWAQLWLMGSVVTACRFSCSVACGILVPQPGIEPTSPALQGIFLTTGPPGKSLLLTYFNKSNICVQLPNANCILKTHTGMSMD